jgi:hypothetical protein
MTPGAAYVLPHQQLVRRYDEGGTMFARCGAPYGLRRPASCQRLTSADVTAKGERRFGRGCQLPAGTERRLAPVADAVRKGGGASGG